MVQILLALLFWTQTPAGTTEPLKLVYERSANATFKQGILDMKGSSGWVRTALPVLDFDLTFEIRGLTLDADPGLVLRTWRGWELWPDRGYRLTLPTGGLADASRLLVGRRENVLLVREGTLDLHPQGEWQTVHVVGERGRITVEVNGTLAGDFAIANHGGYLMFDNRKGRVELRQITLMTSDVTGAIPAGVMVGKQLKASGGTLPEVALRVKPVYTPEAMRGLYQGTVEMEAVVLADGSVGPVRVTRRLHPELDISAVAALKAWRFKPAVVNGAPVPVLVDVEMNFTLK